MASIFSMISQVASRLVGWSPAGSPLSPEFKILFAASVQDFRLAYHLTDGQGPPEPAEILFVQLPNKQNVVVAHLSADSDDIIHFTILDSQTTVISSEPHLSLRWYARHQWSQAIMGTSEAYWQLLRCFQYHHIVASDCVETMSEQITTLQADFKGALASGVTDDLSSDTRVECHFGNQVFLCLAMIVTAIVLASYGSS